MNNKKLKNIAIVLASGSGKRFGSELPKQFLKIGDKTILEHSIDIFERNTYIDEIILVITPDFHNDAQTILKDKYKKLKIILDGGKTRKQSSCIGVNSIKNKEEANVIIHDCARPFLSQDILNNCIKALETYTAVDVALPVTDTILKIKDNFITEIPDRAELYSSQTPQCFKLSLIKKAHELCAGDEGFTDDCGMILKHKLADIYIVNGSADNIKITYPRDAQIANTIYKAKKKTSFEV